MAGWLNGKCHWKEMDDIGLPFLPWLLLLGQGQMSRISIKAIVI